MVERLRGLIFDVDGTLANTERDGHRVAFNRAFAEAGIDWNWSVEFYGKLLTVSGGKERIKYFLQQYLPDYQTSPNLMDFVTYLHKLKTKHYLKLLRSGTIELRPGTERLIMEARKEGVALAITTTTSFPNVVALLEKYLDLDWFVTIAAGDIVPAKKPAPDIFHYVIDKMELPPESLLVLEDSDNGLESATAAGLKTVVTVNNYTVDQDFNQAALVVSNLGEPNRPCDVVRGDFTGDYLDLASLQSILG